MTSRDTLSDQHWIEAAFRALSDGGIQAVRAEALARALKVSKGSFYWHFRDVPALKTAMLAHWKIRGTQEIIAAIADADTPAPASARLHQLTLLATDDRSHPYGGEAVEMAIRQWARHDPDAATTLREVDDQRLTFLTALFIQHGQTAEQAGRHARLLYGALIGLPCLPPENPADLRADLLALLDRLLA
ncbi:TetR/AcrR family transcriptional regulator [Novispirillum itersonii]|uniref:AcrR family transcriptional regulator n=1 Tax=Novispirillum itersonii TaxID=189 RepID=A0A7X0DLY3_NOVIT|nr:TetR/AcrR family transcriptional regulator [Novispirillum itersonii]MBB6210465.1 AcrR family transcriptional regulator [Novispirillum itersonii]